MIRMKQMRDKYQRFDVDFGNPDFAALAEAYGAHGHRICFIPIVRFLPSRVMVVSS